MVTRERYTLNRGHAVHDQSDERDDHEVAEHV
jgi:hypothetical protein